MYHSYHSYHSYHCSTQYAATHARLRRLIGVNELTPSQRAQVARQSTMSLVDLVSCAGVLAEEDMAAKPSR